MIPPVIASGHEYFPRARGLTDAAAEACKRVEAQIGNIGDELFTSLGEGLMWLIALESLLPKADHTYWTKRDQDHDGQVLPGIRYARNAVVHGALVISAVNQTTSAQLGVMQLGATQLGAMGSAWWRDRSNIQYEPPAPKNAKEQKILEQQQQSYDSEIAGKDIMLPLTRALDFLRSAAGT